jgi:hypothetical protein
MNRRGHVFGFRSAWSMPSFLIAALAATVVLAASSSNALAISAPIHISGTGGEGVFIRAEPNTSSTRLGWMPEGASPDYNCFVWGQNINGVPIWFNVNYSGVTGYYASFYDDSSYHSNEELTAKYGVPLCGSAPSPAPPPAPTPSPAPTGSSEGSSNPGSPGAPPSPGTPSAPRMEYEPQDIYYSPYNEGSHELTDRISVKTVYEHQFVTNCTSPYPAYNAALGLANGAPIATLAGWSKGRVGVMSYLNRANSGQLGQLEYVLLIDPGTYGELTCDRQLGAGQHLAQWLTQNPSAHLVVISSSEISQKENSKGIQETYFNAIRKQSTAADNLRARVLTCNYAMSHQTAFATGQYWIAHRIGTSTKSCPWLSGGSHTYKPMGGVGWHP